MLVGRALAAEMVPVVEVLVATDWGKGKGEGKGEGNTELAAGRPLQQQWGMR